MTIQCTPEMSNLHHCCRRVLAKVLLPSFTVKAAPHFSFVLFREENVVVLVHDDTATATNWVLLLKIFGFLVGHFGPTTILHSFLENGLPSISEGLVFTLKNRISNAVLEEGLLDQGFYAG